MRYLILLFFFYCSFSVASAQDKFRYRDLVFAKATRIKNIYYGEPGPAKSKAYFMDIYAPDGDSSIKRPLLVLMHGGGFKLGSKNNSRMKIWGRRFAKMGYVCVSINYRLSKKKPLSRFNDLVESCLDASRDASVAVNYLKQHSRNLRIDTAKIIMAGHSAGAMIALQSVYSSPAEMQQLVQPASPLPGKTYHNRAGIAAVVNFWGAIYDTAWLENDRVPIVSVHGSKDRVVPINFDDTPMYGSAAIHRGANRLKIPNALKIYQGKGHELQRHFNPLYAGPIARKRWREAADFASAFLYNQFFNNKLAYRN